MLTLLDGHNALHRLGIRTGSHEGDRRVLLRRVRAVDGGAIVFFDARHAPPGLPVVSHEEGLEVRYCRGEEADEAILRTIRNATATGAIRVVSDDREITGTARQLGARVSSVRDWFERPTARPSEPPARDRTGPGGFTPADFGLPADVDPEDPPSGIEI